MSGYPYIVKSRSQLPERLRAGSFVALEPAEVRVSFVCVTAAHMDRLWFVASFVRRDWGWSASHYYPMQGGAGFYIGKQDRQALDGDTPRDPLDVVSLTGEPVDLRHRYELRCRLCGVSAVRRSDRLFADLDRYHADGEAEVRLSAYVATM